MKNKRKPLRLMLIAPVLILSIMLSGILTVSADFDCLHGTCNHSATEIVNTTDLPEIMFSECKRVYKIVLMDGVTEIPVDFAARASNLEEINIPSTVKTIASNAFYGCNLHSIIIPEGVTFIGSAAFGNCYNLTDVYLPSTINYLNGVSDGKPFNNTNLKNLTIGTQKFEISALTSTPETIETVTLTEYITDATELELDACPNLQAVYVVDDSPFYSSEDGVLFNKEKTEIIFYPPGKTDTTYKIPDSVETIRTGCFKNSYLKEVELPASLKLVEHRAFDGTALEKISEIPGTVESLKMSAFFNHNLTDVYFDGTEEEWKKITGIYIESENAYYDLEPFYPEVTVHFNSDTPDDPNPPEEPEEPEKPDEHEHNLTSGVIVEATCTENGVKSLFCICGYNYVDIIYATGHKDDDGDYKCDYDCGYEFDKPSEECTCNCHKSGFMGFVWKIFKLFYKLFKTNPVCACGAAHY